MTCLDQAGTQRVRYTAYVEETRDTATPLSEAATHCWYQASSLRLRSAQCLRNYRTNVVALCFSSQHETRSSSATPLGWTELRTGCSELGRRPACSAKP